MRSSDTEAREFPLIKEVNAQRILRALISFKQAPLDRDAQREAILKLYTDKEEKSVFRGMIIPSFRKLGFLQGWEDMISLSANGLLIAEAGEALQSFGMRALRAILLEKDREHLCIVEKQMNGNTTIAQLYERLDTAIASPSDRQRKERLKRWIALLSGAGILRRDGEQISIIRNVLKISRNDLDYRSKSRGFSDTLFQSYRDLVRDQNQVDIVDIADLRCVVAVRYCRQKRLILTERQFDILLRTIPITTDQYLISFGKPMGPEEKLFEFKGNHYRTVSVRYLETCP